MPQRPITGEQLDSAEPTSADGRLVSEAEYWQDWYNTGDLSYEWNNGRLEEKPVSDFETFQVYLWFLELLRHYLRLQPSTAAPGAAASTARCRSRPAVMSAWCARGCCQASSSASMT